MSDDGRVVQVAARARTVASPSTTWSVLADQVAMSTWLPASVSLERPGEPTPNGVGAIRVISRGPVRVREEILAVEEPTRLAYRLLSGLPVRRYAGETTLSSSGSGTTIDWTIRYTPHVPGMRSVMTRVARLLARRLAAEADRVAA